MINFKSYIAESVMNDVKRIFSSGPGGMKKKLDWQDGRRADFVTNKGNSATIIFRGTSDFVVYDNTVSPPNNKLVDSTKAPKPLEDLWTIVWGK